MRKNCYKGVNQQFVSSSIKLSIFTPNCISVNICVWLNKLSLSQYCVYFEYICTNQSIANGIIGNGNLNKTGLKINITTSKCKLYNKLILLKLIIYHRQRCGPDDFRCPPGITVWEF